MKKLVSLRLDEEVIKTLEERKKGFRFWKKHAIMCAILENVLLNADPWDLNVLVRHYHGSSKKLVIRVTEVPF